MPALFEEALGLIDITLVIIFNPVTWLVVASLAYKRKPLWQLMLFGAFAQFFTVAVVTIYNSRSVASTFDPEWLVFAVGMSIIGGVVVGAIIFFLIKLRMARLANKSSEIWL